MINKTGYIIGHLNKFRLFKKQANNIFKTFERFKKFTFRRPKGTWQFQ